MVKTELDTNVQHRATQQNCVLSCELEEDEAGCLLKFMRHAKSHTYHKHGLGYAIWGKGRMGDITIIC